jgi:hypothetical protein
VEADDASGSFLRLEAAHLELGLDVFAADDLGRARLPQRLVEAVIAATAVAVAVVEHA